MVISVFSIKLGRRTFALFLTLCHPGGGPKDPQLSKSPNALKLVFKSGWNVFDFSYIDFMKLFNQKFEIFFGGYPHFGPSKCGVSKNEHPSTAYDPTFFVQNPFLL